MPSCCNHPKETTNESHNHENGQDAGACFIRRRDSARLDTCWCSPTCSCTRIALTCPPIIRADWSPDYRREQRLHNFEDTHLLSHAQTAIERIRRPLQAAAIAINPTSAGFDCSRCRGLEQRHQRVVGEGRFDSRSGHPAREIGFEGALVDIAVCGAFTGFEHDAIFEKDA